jgi:3-deoxy-D-manno-octulosonic-acid transferase
LRGKVSFCRYSAIEKFSDENILLVDTVGKLLSLYSVAEAAFVGGSFRQGIHNVLEAAVYEIPVLFGPRHYNSQEPLMLVDFGGAIVVETTDDLFRALLHLFGNDLARTEVGRKSAGFVKKHTGATDRVTRHILDSLREKTEVPITKPLEAHS